MDYSLLFAIEKIPKKERKTTLKNKEFTGYQKSGDEKIFCKFNFCKLILFKYLEESRHKFLSQCGNYYYHLAIIDYL